MLNTQDILSQDDVLVFDTEALSTFGATTSAVATQLASKRQVAVQDWLYGHLLRAGFAPQKHTVRYPPAAALASTDVSAVDITAAVSDKTTGDLVLASAFAVPATHAVVLASPEPFRGLVVGMLDTVNSQATVLDVEYWNGGAWTNVSSLADGTQVVAGTSFSGGGRVTWALPDDWVKRPLPLSTDATWYYCLRLKVSAAPNGGSVTHLLTLRRSRLTTPAATHALGLLYRESWGVQPSSEWREKADVFLKAAESQVMLALKDLQEFDTEGDEAVSTATTPAAPDPDFFTFQRG